MSDSDLLLVEVYSQTWEYIRHTEAQRDSLVRWHLLIVGGLLAVAYEGVLAFWNDSAHVTATLSERTAILLFLVVFSLIVSAFTVVQKLHYRRYHDRLKRIEARYPEAGEAPAARWRPGAFQLLYLSQVLPGAGLMFLLAFEVAEMSLRWGVIAGIMYFLVVGGMGLWATVVPDNSVTSAAIRAHSRETGSRSSSSLRSPPRDG